MRQHRLVWRALSACVIGLSSTAEPTNAQILTFSSASQLPLPPNVEGPIDLTVGPLGPPLVGSEDDTWLAVVTFDSRHVAVYSDQVGIGFFSHGAYNLGGGVALLGIENGDRAIDNGLGLPGYDLIIANGAPVMQFHHGVIAMNNDGTGDFPLPQPPGPFPPTYYPVFDAPMVTDIALADLNGGGPVDTVASSKSEQELRVHFGMTFNFNGGQIVPASNEVIIPLAAGPEDVAIGNVDNDFDLDIVTINDDSTIAVVLYDITSHTFSAPQYYSTTGTSIALGDLNGDSSLDVVTNTGQILIGSGSGSFTSGGSFTIGATHEVRLGDLDLDGDNDVVSTQSGADTVTVSLNNGSASITTYVTIPVGDMPQGFRMADIDQDGDLDILVANRMSDDVSIIENLGNVIDVDLNDDGCVDGVDLASLLSNWGACKGDSCMGDINGDGFVNGADLAVLLSNWGEGCTEDPGDPELLMAQGGENELNDSGLLEIEGEQPQAVESGVPWVLAALGFESVDDYLSFIDALSDMELFAHINALLEIIQNENE